MEIGDWVKCNNCGESVVGYIEDIDKFESDIYVYIVSSSEVISRRSAIVFPLPFLITEEEQKDINNLFIDLAIARGDEQEFMNLTNK